MIIAIDGPVASGKSTVARLLAARLGFYYLGSGLLYRSLAYLLRRYRNYGERDFAVVSADDIAYLFAHDKFIYTYDAYAQERVSFLGSEIDISLLRTPEIAHDASVLAASALVRKALLKFQRAVAQNHDLVVEGRDAGSVVFPDAEFKFFVTATVGERARRFMHDQKKRGIVLDYQDALKLIEQRDERDQHRAVDPLVIPEGAQIVDTTGHTLEQVISMIQVYMGRV